MKITKIQTFTFNGKVVDIFSRQRRAFKATYGSLDDTNHVIVKIYTDEDIVGIGEACVYPILQAHSSEQTREMVLHLINDYIAPNLIEDDPLNINKIYDNMGELIYSYSGSRNTFAKAAIDMALYDIAGKFYKVPVCKLLDGCYRKKMECSGSVPIGEPQEMAKDCVRFVQNGYRIIKPKVGGSGVIEPKKDVERIKQIRDAVGDEVMIIADVNEGWSPRTAINIINKTHKYDVYFEQPTHGIRGLATVAAAVDAPIIADELVNLGELTDIPEIARLNAANMLNVKLMWPGGISQAMKIIRMAEALGLPCSIDDGAHTGIAGAALAHLAATVNDKTFAFTYHNFRELDENLVKSGGVLLDRNFIKLPDKPGLGLEIKEEMLTLDRTIVSKRA